jgi:signal transduction histidine kinase
MIALCLTYAAARPILPDSYLAVHTLEMAATVLILCYLPFLLAPGLFWQNLFLFCVAGNIAVIAMGAGNYIETNFGAALSMRCPMLVTTLIQLGVYALTVPIILSSLSKTGLTRPQIGLMWKKIWLIPGAFVLLSILTNSIVSGDPFKSAVVIVVRLVMLIAIVTVCSALADSSRREESRILLEANSRMAETRLEAQEKQYEYLADSLKDAIRLRHDLRHHLAAIEVFLSEGRTDKSISYIHEVSSEIARVTNRKYCDNFSVSAVVAYYGSQMEAMGLRSVLEFDVPVKSDLITDSTLCVLIGNLLENALEACRRQTSGEKFICARAAVRGGFLVVRVENSFDGHYSKREGVYMSSKGAAASRDGVGLTSVMEICKRHGGDISIVTDSPAGVWRITATVEL